MSSSSFDKLAWSLLMLILTFVGQEQIVSAFLMYSYKGCYWKYYSGLVLILNCEKPLSSPVLPFPAMYIHLFNQPSGFISLYFG